MKEKQGFRELDTDLQSFTWKLASGFTEMNDLLSHESQLIQEHTTKEARRIEKSMIEYAEFQEARQDTKQTTQKQRERILESLRFNDMNQRRNHITDPHDATFDRIFQSYQCVWERPSQSSSGSQIEFDGYDPTLGHQRPDPIDEAWQSFVTWLRSSDELFWIQGKPGLGKSTLVKSIIYGDSAGETTRTHLDEWKPGTRVLSHFFWRIGTSLQSNSRGLYSSLVYQLFENNDALVDHIARRFPFTATKNCLNDWSFKELEKVLKASLEFDQDKSSFCIFVNGLDEYDDDDGQGGVMEKMKMLARYPNVKVCVSSRPEPQLQKRLDQFPHLKLHHLTWDDMKAYALSQFKSLETEEQLTPDLLETLVQKLLSKAQGVFLWLRLAVRSLIDGIEYEDPEDKLFQRLDQLPRELNELYADMWRKQNRDENIYRESAAIYFQVAIQQDHIEQACLFPPLYLVLIACATQPEVQNRLLDLEHEVDLAALGTICDNTKREILIRCAGMLEIYPGSDKDHPLAFRMKQHVCFIHRTAHDFLVDTAAGNKILRHTRTSNMDSYFGLLKGHLCCARVLGRLPREVKLMGHSCAFLSNILCFLERLLTAEEDGDSFPKSKALDLIAIAQTFAEGHLLNTGYGIPVISPRTQYLDKAWFASLVSKFRGLDYYLLSVLETADAGMATDILRLIEWDSRMSIQVIRKLLRQGADPVALVSSRDHLGTSKLRPGRKRRECYQIAVRVTALWKAVVSFLLNGFLVCEGKDTVFRYATDVDVVVAMLGACHPRVVDNWGLVAPANFDADGGWQRLLYDHLTVFHSEYTDRLTPFFEMDICSMLEIGLRHLASIGEPDLVQRAQALRDWIIDPKPPRLRFIRLLPGSLNHHLGAESETNPLFTRWYRVIDQGPFEDIIQFLFYSPRDVDDDSATEARLQKWYRTARNLVYDPNVLQRVSLEEILEAPASEGRHGICSLKDAGFVEDDEMPSSAG